MGVVFLMGLLFIMPSVEQMLIYYHERVSGVLRSLRGSLSFCGQLRGIRISQLITSYYQSIGVFICHCSRKTLDHLLIHCENAYALWSDMFMMFGIQWVLLLDKVASLLFGWCDLLGKHSSNVRNLVPAYMMWLVWKECGSRIFQESVRPIEQVKSLLFCTMFNWS